MSSVLLRTLQVVQGTTLARKMQGRNIDGSVPTEFEDTDTLASTVWLAQNQPAIITPSVQWSDAPTCQFIVSISNAQSAALTIDTEYNLQVFATRSGVTYCVGWVYLQVLPAAGNQPNATPADLVAGTYAAQLLATVGLNEAQLEALPTLITGASNAIRGYCNRDFLRLTRTAIAAVELDGTVRLGNPPVNQVYRVQNQPETAITIMNSTATTAWVTWQTTGGQYLQSSGLDNLSATGVMLNWTLNGSTTVATLAFTTDETISGLATAINTYANGWTAIADPVLGLWPVTEIFDWQEGKGAGPNDLPDGGAQYNVFSSNVTNHHPAVDDGAKTGIWWVGRQNGDLDYRWGPDAPYWGSLSQQVGETRVKVTYDGGPQNIPWEIQSITVELVKMQLSRFSTDLLLDSEHIADYSYKLAQDQIHAFPKQVQETLARYRVSNA